MTHPMRRRSDPGAAPDLTTATEPPEQDLKNALQHLALCHVIPDGGYRLTEQDADTVIGRIWLAIRKLEAHQCLPASLSEALNSGDGVYRP